MIELAFIADGFNEDDVRPNFINPCCFGEDVAAALREIVARDAPDLQPGAIIQEDYGWGFWLTAGRDPYWVAVSLPEHWLLVADFEPGFNLWKRWLERPDPQAADRVREVLLAAIVNLPGGALVDHP